MPSALADFGGDTEPLKAVSLPRPSPKQPRRLPPKFIDDLHTWFAGLFDENGEGDEHAFGRIAFEVKRGKVYEVKRETTDHPRYDEAS